MQQPEFFKQLSENNENFEELEACPWCGGNSCSDWGEQSYPGFLTVLCHDCGVVYVKRRFNELGRKRLCDGYMEVRQNPDRAEKRKRAHDLELNFIYQFVDRGSVVDVGCGGGYLLERMPQDKWPKKWGTEMGTDAVERARRVLNTTNILEGEIENLDIPKEHFDLAIARGVIEHVPSPRTFLSTVGALVKPGGYFFMSGPNLNSFCAQFYKDKWKLHYPEAHLFHFSVDILTKALEEESFSLAAETYHYLETPYARPEEDILHLAADITARREGRHGDVSHESPPFYGNRYTAIWRKSL